ncbi:MAG: HNH endonuclease [Bacteroidales bacterium]|nr:HNH endonuclease [Bacteroidales bacterium]
MSLDREIRIAAFNWLSEKKALYDDVFSRDILAKGFIYQGERIPLLGPQGIFKPRMMELPLSITTAPGGPYDDSFGPDNFLRYRYRGTDIYHRDNLGLRDAMIHNIPLAYFHGFVPGKYLAVWPVYVVGDDPKSLTFKVATDNLNFITQPEHVLTDNDMARRAYITSTIKVRLHQRAFREKVIYAYQSQCAFCRLRHAELLDAAHIILDTEPDSRPTVDNGLSLCKIHHAAFDKFILGVSPDYIIKVRSDILDEDDGPMLLHGLKEMHNQRIQLPRKNDQQPNREFLERRFERSMKVG